MVHEKAKRGGSLPLGAVGSADHTALPGSHTSCCSRYFHDLSSMRASVRLVVVGALVLSLLIVALGFTLMLGDEWHRPSQRAMPDMTVHTPPRALVLYVWSNNDRHYLGNLRDFIARVARAGSQEDSNFVFILNQSPDAPHWNPHEVDKWPGPNSYVHPTYLPPLPAGSIYIDHPNECYDSGTWGWFLSLLDYDAVRQRAIINPAELLSVPTTPLHWSDALHSGLSTQFQLHTYRYFILMNASVRGPFFPAYMDLEERDETTGRRVWPAWYYPFVHLMKQDPDVKLAGATTSCERRAHVQSYFLFTDHVGLALLRASTGLDCHQDFQSAIDHGEFGLSAAILDAGYNIASLLSPRQGVEYRSLDADSRVRPPPLSGRTSQYCDVDLPPGGSANPLWHPPDGIELNMFDTVFTKWQDKGDRSPAVAKHMQWQKSIRRTLEKRRAARAPTPTLPTPTTTTTISPATTIKTPKLELQHATHEQEDMEMLNG